MFSSSYVYKLLKIWNFLLLMTDPKLKFLKKQPVQEGHCDPSLCLP